MSLLLWWQGVPTQMALAYFPLLTSSHIMSLSYCSKYCLHMAAESLPSPSTRNICTLYSGTEVQCDHRHCRFPIHSGVGLLKAFNNRQILTSFFLNNFSFLKYTSHLIFLGHHRDFYYILISVNIGRSSSAQSWKSILNFKEKPTQYKHNSAFELKPVLFS